MFELTSFGLQKSNPINPQDHFKKFSKVSEQAESKGEAFMLAHEELKPLIAMKEQIALHKQLLKANLSKYEQLKINKANYLDKHIFIVKTDALKDKILKIVDWILFIVTVGVYYAIKHEQLHSLVRNIDETDKSLNFLSGDIVQKCMDLKRQFGSEKLAQLETALVEFKEKPLVLEDKHLKFLDEVFESTIYKMKDEYFFMMGKVSKDYAQKITSYTVQTILQESFEEELKKLELSDEKEFRKAVAGLYEEKQEELIKVPLFINNSLREILTLQLKLANGNTEEQVAAYKRQITSLKDGISKCFDDPKKLYVEPVAPKPVDAVKQKRTSGGIKFTTTTAVYRDISNGKVGWKPVHKMTPANNKHYRLILQKEAEKRKRELEDSIKSETEKLEEKTQLLENVHLSLPRLEKSLYAFRHFDKTLLDIQEHSVGFMALLQSFDQSKNASKSLIRLIKQIKKCLKSVGDLKEDEVTEGSESLKKLLEKLKNEKESFFKEVEIVNQKNPRGDVDQLIAMMQTLGSKISFAQEVIKIPEIVPFLSTIRHMRLQKAEFSAQIIDTTSKIEEAQAKLSLEEAELAKLSSLK
ncbi:MAG: hypothetical protein S4CHLAM20_07600 [Chlamydiia bacterium]|nr:hypothetical protein [Chlamydiia bacterium]